MTVDRKSLLREALKYEDALVCYAYGTLREWHLAKDAVQDALVVLSDKADEYDPDKNLYAWLKRMVRFKVLELCRSRRRDVYVGDETLQRLVVDSLDAGFTREEAESHERRLTALSRCMKALPKRSQDLLIAYYWKGVSCEALSRTWRRSADSLRMALSRVRRTLRACVERTLREMEVGG